MNISIVIILALLSESVWETLKMTWQKGKISTDRIGALIISMLIVFATGLDIFKILNVEAKAPGIGMVLTAILLSRGSNFIHDLIGKITDIKSVNNNSN
ncbi:hypothetical protein ACQPU1_08340 [Clostridium paraputrificum]|uniref:hypothetical protein n=1 Tax=Clostridium TaxID=1485 RepID=UPI003D3319DB